MSRPTVVGACSGAYTAFHGIRTDARIKRAVIVNLQCFQWSPSVGYELERWKSLRRAEANSTKTATEGATDLVSLIKAQARATAMACVRRAGRVVKGAVRRGRLHVNGGVGQDVRSWFRGISERGCDLMLVYSAGDTGLVEFQHWTGPMGSYVTRLPGISLRLIDNADHNLTSPDARAAPSAASGRLLGGKSSGTLCTRLRTGAAPIKCPLRDARIRHLTPGSALNRKIRNRRHEVCHAAR